MICDLQRGDYYIVSNSIIHILKVCEKKPYSVIQNIYCEELEEINKVINQLEEMELGFWTDDPKRFPKISENWFTPNIVDNSIIEIEEFDSKFIEFINELNNLGCKFIELRVVGKLSINDIEKIFDAFRDSKLRGVNLYIAFNDITFLDKIETFLIQNPKLIQMFVHGSNELDILKIKLSEKLNKRVYFTKNSISNKSCGIIDEKYFLSELNFFNESKHFNNCLNKKICIDKKFDIKNCLSLEDSFGNFMSNTILDVINSTDLKSKWKIKKDSVKVCKDCEFRYNCSDCRAYLEDPNDIYSKPLKCGYDPYLGTWNDWKTDPKKQDAIKFYNL